MFVCNYLNVIKNYKLEQPVARCVRAYLTYVLRARIYRLFIPGYFARQVQAVSMNVEPARALCR